MTYDTHTARAQLEHAIADAIAFLDLCDGDCDLEPSLGSYRGSLDNYDLEGDAADDEPSLGSLGGIRQDGNRWHGGSSTALVCNTDLEHEHDGREPDVDDEPEEDDDKSDREPLLGAPEAGDGPNRGWWESSPLNTGDGEREVQDHDLPQAAARGVPAHVLVQREADETRRLAGWIGNRCQAIIDADRRAVRP